MGKSKIEVALVSGRKNFHDGNDSETIAVIQQLEEHYPFDNRVECEQYTFLMAISLVRLRKLNDAEPFVVRLKKDFAGSPESYFAAASWHALLREHDETISAGENYLELVYEPGEDAKPASLTNTDGCQSCLLDMLATALKETGKFDEAIGTYERAIAADSGNHFPYLNLGNLHLHRKEWAKAAAVVNRGMGKCRQVQELRLLHETCQPRESISACMIVKDEEELLGQCLQSIRDWVDEIIIVDTGSTDRTVEIAQSFGAKVFHQPWEGNFSKHRNFSMEQATSDWLFIIDADEEMFSEDIPLIRKCLSSDAAKLVSVNVINVYRESEKPSTFLPSERFLKRELNLRYDGIVHNQLMVPDDLLALRTSIRIRHHGYGLTPEKMRLKMARTIELLKKQLAENPDHAFAHFNLAQQLRSGEDGFPVENAPDIIEHAGRGVALTDPVNDRERHIHLMCLDQLAWTYFFTGEYDKASEYCERALSIKPDYVDPLLLRGHIAVQQHHLDEAIRHYNYYLEKQAAYDHSQEMSNIIFLHVDSAVIAHYALGMIYHGQDNLSEARDQYEKTLACKPDYMEANFNLGHVLLQLNCPDDAERCFLRQLEVSKNTGRAASRLATIYIKRNEPEKAEKYLSLAVESDRNNASAWFNLGRLQGEAGRLDQAMDSLEQAARLSVDNPTLQKEVGDTYFKLKQYVRAGSVYQSIIEKGQAGAETFNDLGNSLFKQNNLAEAEAAYLRALEFSPELPIVYRNLGLTQVRLEKNAAALISLERFMTAEPGEKGFLLVIGDLYSKLGEYESALNSFEKYLGSHPRDLVAIFGLSECYLLMGHGDSALVGYQKILEIDPNFEPAQKRVLQLAENAGRVSV